MMFLCGTALAQVPQLINYQGRVAVAGVNFDGSGQFKFALIDGGTSTTPQVRTATATATVANNFVVDYTVTDGGAGYTSAPAVTISGDGSGATATATVSGGVVTAITPGNPGSGYTGTTTVTVGDPPPATSSTTYISYWSNDATSTAGSEPAGQVTLPVAKGLYSVLLGDPTISGMGTISATIFANPDVRLRIWFNDGTHGFQLMTPDQRIAAVGYAVMAGSVADGSVTSAKLAPGAAAANLQASGQATVPSGGMVMSTQPNDQALTGAGYIAFGTVVSNTDGASAPPSSRYGHVAVWTGTELIVWGGSDTGARFNLGRKAWIPMSTVGVPTLFENSTAVWTGTEMIVWGQSRVVGVGGAGGRYNPTTDTWSAVDSSGAPSGCKSHTAVWTGSEMIVWGGYLADDGYAVGGKRYNPETNTWSAMSGTGAPTPRGGHTAVWTGTQMIVWGGEYKDTGGLYDPATDTWTPSTTTGAPSPRSGHTAVWTGSRMIVWGGSSSSEVGLYNPSTDTWTTSSLSWPAPSPRSGHTAVWTGTEMIVWGGIKYINDGSPPAGYRYNPSTDHWIPMAPPPLSNRKFQLATWADTQMLVWGGWPNNPSPDGAGYDPVTDTWPTNLGPTVYLYRWP
jgi:N-acetylneuraminic acid mutarotase